MDYSTNFVFISPWNAVILFKQLFGKKTKTKQNNNNNSNKYSANSTESNLKDALCHQQWYSWVQTCQHHQISAETRAQWNFQQVRGKHTIRITIKVKVDWAFWLISGPGEQKRLRYISVLGREKGEKEMCGGGEWCREIEACGKWSQYIFASYIWDVRIDDS